MSRDLLERFVMIVVFAAVMVFAAGWWAGVVSVLSMGAVFLAADAVAKSRVSGHPRPGTHESPPPAVRQEGALRCDLRAREGERSRGQSGGTTRQGRPVSE